MSPVPGWTYAVLSALCFGSFGVPIKSRTAVLLEIDPLVFQSYKTAACLLTSPLVLLVPGTEISFTPWGIVSGVFWVPSGVAAIYAVRRAGLAVGQGVWSALIVIVSFTWGVGVFGEEVRSALGAAVAGLSMVFGLLGMSYYSFPREATEKENDLKYRVLRAKTTQEEWEEGVEEGNTEATSKCMEEEEEESDDDDEDSGVLRMYKIVRPLPVESPENTQYADIIALSDKRTVTLWGHTFSSYNAGLAAAIFNGTWGGSILVPLHYSSGETKGLQYVISFSVGATVVTVALWALRYVYHLFVQRSYVAAFQKLPPFHLSEMWLPGGTAGILWSMGNICSIMSVTYLGEGVGYSVIQSGMIVSGIWGIFWYKEIQSCTSILKWFGSAMITIGGILLLGYVHIN